MPKDEIHLNVDGAAQASLCNEECVMVDQEDNLLEGISIKDIELPEGLSRETFGRALHVLNDWEFWSDDDSPSSLIIRLYTVFRNEI